MSTLSDYPDDMRFHRTFDEQATEDLLAGRVPVGQEDLTDLAQLVQGVRWAAQSLPAPRPNAELARVLATGLDQTREPVEAAPLSAVKRGKIMIARLSTALVAKLAALSFFAKSALAATATAGVVAGAAAAGFIPTDVGGGGQGDPVQPAVAEPASETAEAAPHGEPASETAEAARGDHGIPEDGEHSPADGWLFGLEVARHNAAEQARIHDQDFEPGSETAEAHRPAEVQTGRPESTPNGQPEGTPDGQPEGTPDGQPEGTPDGQPEGRPSGQPETLGGQPDEPPAGTPESTPGDDFRP
jgi:hypothetical protein